MLHYFNTKVFKQSMVYHKEKIDKILLWVIRIGLFSILFTPLIFSSQAYFPFIVMKNVLFRIFVEIIFFAYILLIFRRPEFRIKIHPLIFVVFLFFAFYLFSSIFSVNFNRSFWGDYERMGGLFGFLHLLGFFITLVGVVKSRKEWNSLLTFSIFSSAIMSFFALAQKFNTPWFVHSGGGERLTGTIGNAIYLASYMLFHIFFLLYFLVKEKEFNLKLFFWSVLGGDLFIILRDLYLNILYSGKDAAQPSAKILPLLPESKEFLFAIVVFHILVLGVWIMRKQRIAVKTFIAILLFFEILVLSWTQTRGAMLGFVGGLLFITIAGSFLYRGKIIGKIYLSFLGLIIVSILGIYLGRNLPIVKRVPILERLTGITLEDLTTQSRILAWEASWKGWTGWGEHTTIVGGLRRAFRFVFGFGPENYFVVFDKYFPVKIYRDSGSQIWFDRAHNIIFDTGVVAGFFGLVVYIGIFYFIFKTLLDHYKKEKDFALSFIMCALVFAYFIQNLFVFDTVDSLILFFLIIGFVSYLYFDHEKKMAIWLKSISDRASLLFKKIYIPEGAYIGSAVVVLFFVIYAFNVRLIIANRALFNAVRSTYTDSYSYKKNVELFSKSIDLATTGKLEARYQLAQYAIALGPKREVKDEDLDSVVQEAVEQVEKSVKEDPLNVRQYLLLAQLYNRFAFLHPSYADKAIDLMEKAIILSPDRPHIYLEFGYAHIFKGEKNKGLEYFQKAIRLAPDTKEVRVGYLLILIKIGRYKEASEELGFIKKQFKNSFDKEDYLDIIQAYTRNSQYDAVIGLYKAFIELDPSSRNYAQMAVAYARIGDDKNAEKSMMKAIEIDSSITKEAEKFFKALREGKLKLQ